MAQTTAVNCNGTYGAYSSVSFPAGAWSWQMRLKWASFTSSNGAQNVASITLTNSHVVQIYLDTASATMRVYRSQNSGDDSLINLWQGGPVGDDRRSLG